MNLIDEIYNKIANYTVIKGKNPKHLILSRDYYSNISVNEYKRIRIDEMNFPEIFGMIVSVIPGDKEKFMEVL